MSASVKKIMWEEYNYTGPVGSRPYFVYTPSQYQPGTLVPLIVMLHGCTQTAADFALGTRMNLLADQQQCIVVYPQQVRKSQHFQCWNWYDLANQFRGSGEPAIIAGIVQEVVQNTAQWTIDSRRIYIAGISAGGATAITMGATYPDLFAAIGVQAGVEYQAATSARRALGVMRRGGPNPRYQAQAAFEAMGHHARVIPIIVFQGDKDRVVSVENAEQVLQQWMSTNAIIAPELESVDFKKPSSITPGQVPAGRAYTIFRWNDSRGRVLYEYWNVHGMGHAWSGGYSGGSFTDKQGPSATFAMYTFFMNHQLPRPPQEEAHEHDHSFWEKLRHVLGDLFKEKREE